MPTEPEDYYYADKIGLIRELFLEDDYQSGIEVASVLKNNLCGAREREKYYCDICKLMGLGYRKWKKPQRAFSVLCEAERFAKNMYEKTNDDKWIIEKAIVRVNIGAVYFSIGAYHEALGAFSDAMPIFEHQNDRKHLIMLYQSIAETQAALGDIDSAESTMEILKKMKESSYSTPAEL